MPELPEVEVTRQSFADRIRGACVTAVRVGKPREEQPALAMNQEFPCN